MCNHKPSTTKMSLACLTTSFEWLASPKIPKPAYPNLLSSNNSTTKKVTCKYNASSNSLKLQRLGRRSALLGLLGVSSFINRGLFVSHVQASENKRTNLNIDDIKSIIETDLSKNQYYVTGNMTKEIYRNNCRFKDPTTDLVGLENYIRAVKFLFDPETSKLDLLSISVVDPRTVEAKWRLEGYLKFPWRPHINPYEGSTRYVMDDDGLVMSHEETWNISVLTAFKEFFLPSWMSS